MPMSWTATAAPVRRAADRPTDRSEGAWPASRSVVPRPVAIPGDRAPDALGEGDDDLVAEPLAGEPDVRLRMAHVARAGVLEDRLDGRARGGTDEIEQLEQAGPRAAADVAGQLGRAGLVGRQEVGPHDVLDEREVPARLPVAVDRRAPALEDRGREPRDHRGVFRVRVLAGPEHVEIPKDDRLDPVELPKRVDVVLARQLAGGIWRAGIGSLRLARRQLGAATIDRRRAGEHQPSNAVAR